MTLLSRFDPPALLADFNSIPGQLEAWHRAVSAWFDMVVSAKTLAIGGMPQYYNPAKFDPGGVVVEQAVTWNAFPKEMLRRYGRERALQLADMVWPIERYRMPTADPAIPPGKLGVVYRPQEEYCEWHVVRHPDTNEIQRITFTSEPPEYWQALFGLIPGPDGVEIAFPGDKDLLLRLYRELVSPEVELDDLIGKADINDAQGNPLVIKGQYNIYNKWNTTHGIIHLNAPPNSLMAEIQLGGDATVLYNDPRGRRLVEPEALICYANYGGPNRNSDPTIGAAVNALARLGAYVTLRNPVGLYMDHIDLSGWEAPGDANVSDFVHIARGAPGMIERLVIDAPAGHELSVSDLTIAGAPLRFGGQVAECITVKLVGIANILSMPVENPAVATQVRCAIDPDDPRTVSRSVPASKPLPPGTVEAFREEGARPGGASKKTAKSKQQHSKAIVKGQTRAIHRCR
jgi:hypothetical protein